MIEDRKIVIRCRAIILHEGKLLVVRHAMGASFAALPGGHLEWGEDVQGCLKREIVEELGIEPEIGRLLYVHTFTDERNIQSVEFFFEVVNGSQYIDTEKRNPTHAHELAEIMWASPSDTVKILPKKVEEDFKAGNLLANEPRYSKG